MNKKAIIITIILVFFIVILGLWVGGIIPKQIAKISATYYLKKNFPEKQYEFVDIEWSSSFGAYSITFKDECNNTVGFFMPYKYFPIEPGQGTFALEDSYRIEFGTGIADINDVYNHSITDDYTDIRSLPQNYSLEDAQKDNSFVIGAMVHNDNLYTDFMNKYNNKENAFIRVVQSTIEGDTFIIDLLYEARNDKIHLVKDYTRDKFFPQEDRTVQYTVYEKTGVWEYQDSKYWVAYTGELPDGTIVAYNINPDKLFIITTIN